MTFGVPEINGSPAGPMIPRITPLLCMYSRIPLNLLSSTPIAIRSRCGSCADELIRISPIFIPIMVIASTTWCTKHGRACKVDGQLTVLVISHSYPR